MENFKNYCRNNEKSNRNFVEFKIKFMKFLQESNNFMNKIQSIFNM